METLRMQTLEICSSFERWIWFKELPVLNAQKTFSPSTQEGLLRVVPATFPGRQEHLTVCERSSMRFLLQHRWAAITSQVPPSADRHRDRGSGYETAVSLLLVIPVV